MEDLIVILKDINIGQTVALILAMWFFYQRLDKKIEKLSDKVEDIDRRVCRIEGSLVTQGHCLFHQSTQEKKAE